MNAQTIIRQLQSFQSDEELQKIKKYFKSGSGQYAEGDIFMGIKMGQVFEIAKTHADLPISEIEKLLENPIHEVRVAAVSIMDKASRKKIIPERLQSFYELYMRRHDRINNWDLVDLGCLHLTGSYLFDKPRGVLYDLAKSENLWERRTAILSTCYFIRKNDLDDTYKIAEMLLGDKEDMVHKAAGWMLRFAGDKNPERLMKFLDKFATKMPRVMLRNAIEKMEKPKREHYLKLK